MRDIRGGALDVIGGMRVLFGVCGTDHLPEIDPAGLPFFGLTPPTHHKSKNRNGKRPVV